MEVVLKIEAKVDQIEAKVDQVEAKVDRIEASQFALATQVSI